MRGFWIIFLLLYAMTGRAANSAEAYLNYIELYAPIAQEEMKISGIPASIKLAQGLLESNAGRSHLALQANNHFGIKCGSSWSGEFFNKVDDEKDSRGRVIASCFRKYKSAEESYKAHTEFLTGKTRYSFLFRYESDDYKNWAQGLQKAGYATNPRYSRLLIDIIERYSLHKYDEHGDFISEVTPQKQKSKPAETKMVFNSHNYGAMEINDVDAVRLREGESLLAIADAYNISIKKLFKYNELKDASPHTKFGKGEVVYLQPKRNRYRGKQKYHTLQTDETVYSVSQKYGIKEKKLRKRNDMEDGEQPNAGTSLRLR